MSIQKLWESEEVPYISGIFYENGTVYKINVIRKRNNTAIQFDEVDILSNIHVPDSDYLTSIDSTAIIEFSELATNFTAHAGYGGMGDMGFVSLLSKGVVKWMAFFLESNPFERISYRSGNLYATNNLGEQWVFPINFPEKVWVLTD